MIYRVYYTYLLVSLQTPILSRLYLIAGMVILEYVGRFVLALATIYTLIYMDYFGWRTTLDPGAKQKLEAPDASAEKS